MRVLFVFSDYSLHNHIVEDYVRARPGDAVAIVKVPLVLKGKSRTETAQRIVPRLSRRFLFGKLTEFFVLLAITLTPKIMRRGAVFRRLRWIARRHDLPFLRTDNIMGDPAITFIGSFAPDVVVTMFHQIVKQPLIDIPRLGVVNIHPGILPEFRGIQPYFWELSEGSSEGGCSLHLIEDETIDTGGVLAQSRYAIPPKMSVQRNYWVTCRHASKLLPDVAARLEAGTITPQPQDEGVGDYYRFPDGAAFDRLKERGHCLFSWRQLWKILAGVE